ncbi:biopolymer transporter ExbD [Geminicoccaceae bacterium 1502E]|nr:biopolymer transporter ExbD [Geminicoccaceae bacterium 1502E]
MALGPHGIAGLHGGGLDEEEAIVAPVAEINVTPLVDVMLVLLIIFMVAAPMMLAGVPLDLPKAGSSAVVRQEKPLIVSVTREGNVHLAGDVVANGALKARLDSLRAEHGDAMVHVRGDRGVDYGRMMSVLAALGEAGFARVSLIGEARPAAGS